MQANEKGTVILTLLDINEMHSSSRANIGTKDSLVTEKVGELSF